jgi:hypothetical protein
MVDPRIPAAPAAVQVLPPRVRIVTAVCAAIHSDADHLWCAFLPRSGGHTLHVRDRQAPDGFDAQGMSRLSRYGRCQRLGLTHTERADGSLRPVLLTVSFAEAERADRPERREGPRKGPEYRADLWNRLPAPETVCEALPAVVL